MRLPRSVEDQHLNESPAIHEFKGCPVLWRKSGGVGYPDVVDTSEVGASRSEFSRFVARSHCGQVRSDRVPKAELACRQAAATSLGFSCRTPFRRWQQDRPDLVAGDQTAPTHARKMHCAQRDERSASGRFFERAATGTTCDDSPSCGAAVWFTRSQSRRSWPTSSQL